MVGVSSEHGGRRAVEWIRDLITESTEHRKHFPPSEVWDLLHKEEAAAEPSTTEEDRPVSEFLQIGFTIVLQLFCNCFCHGLKSPRVFAIIFQLFANPGSRKQLFGAIV